MQIDNKVNSCDNTQLVASLEQRFRFLQAKIFIRDLSAWQTRWNRPPTTNFSDKQTKNLSSSVICKLVPLRLQNNAKETRLFWIHIQIYYPAWNRNITWRDYAALPPATYTCTNLGILFGTTIQHSFRNFCTKFLSEICLKSIRKFNLRNKTSEFFRK